MSLKFRLLAGLAVMLTASAASAANIVLSFQLYDPLTFDPLPTSGANTYDLQPNQEFLLRASVIVQDPNLTDTNRSATAFDNQPLGVQTLAGQIIPSVANVAIPQADTAPDPDQWLGFAEIAGLGQPSFVNLLALGPGGSMIPSGAGTSNSTLNLPNPGGNAATNAANLAKVQVGVSAVIDDPEGIFEGLYKAGLSGSTQLTFNATTSQVFTESSTNSTALASVVVPFSNIPVTINIVPEPTGIALAGLGMLGMIAAVRRRRTA
jgi:MYXO-CTERM domain-containing protein